jgi:hypothetical protein
VPDATDVPGGVCANARCAGPSKVATSAIEAKGRDHLALTAGVTITPLMLPQSCLGRRIQPSIFARAPPGSPPEPSKPTM